MASNQAYLFLIFTLNGILIGFLFDIFRILRKSFKTSDIITYIQDIIFWILTGAIILFSMCKFCDGELRGFTIIGIILGTMIYMLTISTYIIKLSLTIINILKKILRTIIKILSYPFNLVFKPISIIYKNLRNILSKIVNKIIKNVKKIKILNKKEGFYIKKEKNKYR